MSTTTKRNSRCRSDDTMDDDTDDKDDTKRKSRNLSEKKRRDQFNLLVNELSSMVSSGSRKMDKSTVLKSTISFLKNHNEISVRSRVHEIQEDWKPAFLSNEEFTHLVLEAVDGFIMVFSTSGQIFYASESITSLLGHLPNDVLSMTIYEMACEEEQSGLYSVLLSPADKEGRNEVSFSCHIRRGGTETPRCFELVHFAGYFRSDADMLQADSNRYSGYSGEADTRIVFVGTGRLQTPQLLREMSVADSTKSEFTSRHSLEWKFLFLDHRAPPIIGYLPFELLGTSGYDYYHVDDLDKVVSCHEALMQKGEGTSCYYRFLTKGQQWIWLQTRFYITYHQWNSKPEFIVCTHRVVSYADVLKQTNIGSDAGDILCESSPTRTPGSGAASPWAEQTSKSRIRTGTGSDCTSMSADSPTSRHSTHLSQHANQQRTSHIQVINHTVSPQTTRFMEPPQYVAAVPVQQVIAGFPSPAVLSPLPPVDSMVMSAAQSQLQSELQRKHAELQTMIGQQQAELRRVSEQLLMARLGLLPATQQQQPATVINVSVPYVCSGNVSSTTSTGYLQVPIQGTEVLTQIPPNNLHETTLSLAQPQTQLLFSAPHPHPQQK